MMVRCYLRAEEIPPERGWALVEWLRGRGADTFTIRLMSIVDEPTTVADEAERVLLPWKRPAAVRTRAVVYKDDPEQQSLALWSLTPESIAALNQLMPDGIFTHPSYDRLGWLEELALYDGKALRLAVVSHEDEAYALLTPGERLDLHEMGIPTHDKGIWI